MIRVAVVAGQLHFIKIYTGDTSLLKQVEKKESDYAIAMELLKEFKLIVDSMEQPRERPSDNQDINEYFSGNPSFVTLGK